MGDNGPMDAFVSFLQTPWAVVVGLVLAVLVGLVIRLVVSSRQRPSDDVSVPAQPQVPATGESPTPTQADEESPEQPNFFPQASRLITAHFTTPPQQPARAKTPYFYCSAFLQKVQLSFICSLNSIMPKHLLSFVLLAPICSTEFFIFQDRLDVQLHTFDIIWKTVQISTQFIFI